MRRFLPATAIVALAVDLLAQTLAPPPSKEDPPEALCVVAGRVVTAVAGRPVKSVHVALEPEDPGPDHHIYAVATDGDGRFSLKDVPPGRYQFFASREEFVEQHYLFPGATGEAVFTLRPGQKISDVLFRMTAAAVITGRVTNEDGEAMIRVQVIALRKPNEDELEDQGPYAAHRETLLPAGSSQTDDRGHYRIFGLKPGEYYIRAVDSFEPEQGYVENQGDWVRVYLGSEYAPAYYPGVTQVSQAQLISVKAGDEVTADVLMQRTKTVEIAGRVIGRDGPAKSTWVNLEQYGVNDGGIDRQATTNETGNFTIKGVPPGSYVIVAYQGDDGQGHQQQGRQKIEVNGENIDGLTVSLGAGMTFQGRVTVATGSSLSLDRVRVQLFETEENEEFGGLGIAKKDGSFEITSVKEGNYAIRVWGLENDWYLKSARLGANDVLEKGLEVENGAPGGRLEIVISPASAQLEGSVTDGDKPVIGAHVSLIPDPETPYVRFRWHRTTTDQTGHFSTAGVAPGKYRVIAWYRATPGSESLKSDPQILTLSEQDHKTIQLVIPKPHTE